MDNEKLEKGKKLSEKISKLIEHVNDLNSAVNKGDVFKFVASHGSYSDCNIVLEDAELTKMIAAIIRAKLLIRLNELENEFERL